VQVVGDALVLACCPIENRIEFLLLFLVVLQEQVVDADEPGLAFVIAELTRLNPGKGLFEFSMFG
jgi:hypothetical protein